MASWHDTSKRVHERVFPPHSRSSLSSSIVITPTGDEVPWNQVLTSYEANVFSPLNPPLWWTKRRADDTQCSALKGLSPFTFMISALLKHSASVEQYYQENDRKASLGCPFNQLVGKCSVIRACLEPVILLLVISSCVLFVADEFLMITAAFCPNCGYSTHKKAHRRSVD